PTPYPALNAVLVDLVQGARAALADSFVGAYLQGSFAVGDADEHSDVDFLIATAGELPDAQVGELESMHQRIHDTAGTAWARHLEGSYVPLRVLRRHVPPGARLPYLDNGSRVIEQSDHDDTLVVRWVLREHGIVLSGPDPKALVDPVPADRPSPRGSPHDRALGIIDSPRPRLCEDEVGPALRSAQPLPQVAEPGDGAGGVQAGRSPVSTTVAGPPVVGAGRAGMERASRPVGQSTSSSSRARRRVHDRVRPLRDRS